MMKKDIFCSFSGGGYRATFFHAGILRKLVDLGLKERVRLVSTVSGGSIVGTLFCLRYDEIQNVADYDRLVLEPLIAFSRRDVRSRMVGYRIFSFLKDIAAKLAFVCGSWGGFFSFFQGRSNSEILMKYLNQELFHEHTMADLSKNVDIAVNATNLNAGARWRFKRTDFGDYKTGYSYDVNEIPAAFAVAASACFPGLFSPLECRLESHRFFYRGGKKEEEELEAVMPKSVFLADGGIYDNLGYYALQSKLESGGDGFLIISDASRHFTKTEERYQLLNEAARGVDILMEQVANRDRRIIMSHLNAGLWQGAYIKLERSCEYYRASGNGRGTPAEQMPLIGWPEGIVARIARVRTDLNFFTDAEVKALVCHGETLLETNLAKWQWRDYQALREQAENVYFADMEGEEALVMAGLKNSHQPVHF